MVHADELMRVFNATLGAQYRTRLVRGTDEPLYLPADEHCPYHRIYFAHGFAASALHELAHWCQAGPARRQQVDYGYWYHPDGRDAEAQARFEQVEAQPQAIEWMLSRACGHRFDVSADNLSIEVDRGAFARTVLMAVHQYYQRGLPPRAAALMAAFGDHFGRPLPRIQDFALREDGRVCTGTHH
ncbi:elongation factor P hydroxylase [Ferrimonas balearica]|uniref:elongation factor P hydroxylase n=1 Tax=Ferrimonas balearica TaxID=44012 RepID=UPI001C99EAAE|nr:elongation factor P hydroxylase [Ferrimonas balearica]MBY5993759.1 elongation factor P hydroxylase [Ferrimonas balearica]